METPTQLQRRANDWNAAASIPGPNSGQFYIGPSRRNALKELWFGLSGGDACVLTGEAGLGKTLLCRELLRRLPLAVHSIYTVAPQTTQAGNDQSLIDNIEQSVSMMRAAQDAVEPTTIWQQDPAAQLAVIVDEAQRLSVATLQRLADWRRREANKNRSVGLLLIGSSALEPTLVLPELRHLNLQISVRCELPYFQHTETQSYIEHWLKSSMTSAVDFSPAATRMVHYATAGVPQDINQVCRNVLASVNMRGDSSITALMVARAIWKTMKLRGGKGRSDALKQIDQTTVIAALLVADTEKPSSRQD